MLKSTLAELKSHPSRFIAVCLAIVLGVGFAVSTIIFTTSVDKGLARSVAAELSTVDVLAERFATDGVDLAKLAALPGVASVEPQIKVYQDFSTDRVHGSLMIDNLPANAAMRWYTLSSGTWPTQPNEIAVDIGTADRNQLTLGTAVQLGDIAGPIEVTVVGIVDTQASPLAGTADTAYAPVALLNAMATGDQAGIEIPYRAYLIAEPGTTAQQLAADINALPGGEYQATTAAEVTQKRLDSLDFGTGVIAFIFVSFVVLAGLVAAMVVANTFTILITGRQRQIALLRCVGATSSQVRRSTLLQALTIAVVGSVLGVLVGVGVGWLGVVIAGVGTQNLAFNVPMLVVAAVIGILVTVIAAVGPSNRAMSIKPLAALRPAEALPSKSTSRLIHGILAALAFLGGLATLGFGIYLRSFQIATLGGAVTAIGVIAMLPLVLPRILQLLGGLGRLAGTTGKLAVANSLRNRRRAAATCTALVIGVGSIVTLQVAAASAQTSADSALAASRPLDLQISAHQQDFPQAVGSAVAAIDGVASVVSIAGTQISTPDDPGMGSRLYGVSAEQISKVLLAGTIEPGTIVVPDWIRANTEPGQDFIVNRGGKEFTFAISPQRVTDDGSYVVNASDLATIDPAAATRALWVKFDSGASPNDVLTEVNTILGPYRDLATSGSGTERAALESVLDTLIIIALALLAVAVVIAIVGIGNTLGLSVLERTRESALLRALGLRRRQLRLMLALEAVFIAVVAAIVGIFFGTIFGFAGVTAAFGETGREVVLTVPWLELGLVFLGAIAAGVLASVLPARRAARATPVEALAEV